MIPCEIVKKYCWYGKRGNSSLLINYKGIEYYVSIKRKKCDEIDEKKTINLYYNKRFDYFFLKEHLNFKIICFFGFLVFFVFCFKYLPRSLGYDKTLSLGYDKTFS